MESLCDCLQPLEEQNPSLRMHNAQRLEVNAKLKRKQRLGKVALFGR